MITTLDIMQYKAGWLETHNNEWLDDETAMSCLQDEHDAVIEKLIEDDLQHHDVLVSVLCNGFDGYKNSSLAELWEEMNTRADRRCDHTKGARYN